MDSNNNKLPMINREQSMAMPLPARIMEVTGPEEMPIENVWLKVEQILLLVSLEEWEVVR